MMNLFKLFLKPIDVSTLDNMRLRDIMKLTGRLQDGDEIKAQATRDDALRSIGIAELDARCLLNAIERASTDPYRNLLQWNNHNDL